VGEVYLREWRKFIFNFRCEERDDHVVEDKDQEGTWLFKIVVLVMELEQFQVCQVFPP